MTLTSLITLYVSNALQKTVLSHKLILIMHVDVTCYVQCQSTAAHVGSVSWDTCVKLLAVQMSNRAFCDRVWSPQFKKARENPSAPSPAAVIEATHQR